MAKAKRVLTCQSCGHQTAKWLGKCPDCDAWNSYVEEAVVMPRKGRTASNPQRKKGGTGIKKIKERLRNWKES
jgi:DNA repair protein RadA/Sms